MGRELRRKQAKKEGKSLKKERQENVNPLSKYVKIIILLIFIFISIYVISGLFITKELKWFGMNKSYEGENVQNSILASSSFNQIEEEYYVYYYDFNEDDNSFTKIVNNKLQGKKVYYVDTSSALNVNYITGESGNKEAKNISELKIKAPTVVKIISEELVEYYEGEEINNIK